jgi:uncharacterized protein with PIN domain
MDQPGVCPSCNRDLAKDREDDKAFHAEVSPAIRRRYKLLWVLTLALLFLLMRQFTPLLLKSTSILDLRFGRICTYAFGLVALHVVLSRCPYCRAFVFLLRPPSQCPKCKGRLV